MPDKLKGYYHTPLAVYVLDNKPLFILGEKYKILKYGF